MTRRSEIDSAPQGPREPAPTGDRLPCPVCHGRGRRLVLRSFLMAIGGGLLLAVGVTAVFRMNHIAPRLRPFRGVLMMSGMGLFGIYRGLAGGLWMECRACRGTGRSFRRSDSRIPGNDNG